MKVENQIRSTLACNLDRQILQAAWPLLKDEKIDAIEWSFDALYQKKVIPEWFFDFISEFSRAGRLIGHGVYFSIFSGRWLEEQENWLNQLSQLSAEFTFDHITEHFGFMTGADFHKGAPVSVPMTESTLHIGQDRLKRIYDVCQCPVGLENLAFAYSIDEIKKHGDFLTQLIEPVNGFIILDLHNIYCQLHNFDIAFDDIIKLYPLDRVREIHISGGSWEDSTFMPRRKIRRDTHDNAVPSIVFELLEKTIPMCPNLKYVSLEQLGASLLKEEAKRQFRNDYLRMHNIIKSATIRSSASNEFIPASISLDANPPEDLTFYDQQMELSQILEQASTPKQAENLLRNSTLSNSAWNVENWNPYMLETVMLIVRKWKDGFEKLNG